MSDWKAQWTFHISRLCFKILTKKTDRQQQNRQTVKYTDGQVAKYKASFMWCSTVSSSWGVWSMVQTKRPLKSVSKQKWHLYKSSAQRGVCSCACVLSACECVCVCGACVWAAGRSPSYINLLNLAWLQKHHWQGRLYKQPLTAWRAAVLSFSLLLPPSLASSLYIDCRHR